MSLTSFLKKPNIKANFKNNFPLKRQKIAGELVAPPITKNYSLIGTAFDYLLRFYIKQINPNVHESETWIADSGLEIIKKFPMYAKLSERAEMLLETAKKDYKEYLDGGIFTKSLIESSIRLAQLDLFYRILPQPEISKIDKNDIRDLNNLTEIINPEIFCTDNQCFLNPSFGNASELVGGADADLIIGDTLIDIKTTKNLSFRSEFYFQLIGYYILSRIGGIDGFGMNYPINKIGVYFSRFGVLHTINISEIQNNPKFDEFIAWFETQASLCFN